MQNYNYYYPPLANYIDDQRALLYNASLPHNNVNNTNQSNPTTENLASSSSNNKTSPNNNHRVLRETPTKREERLSRNAERMRERRALETPDERRKRLDRNALSNRIRRLNESNDQKKLRQARNAARQRLRRAMETQEERDQRLKKLSERMREVRSKDDSSVSQQPYTPRRPKSDSKKQSSYSEDDSFDTSVSVDSNPQLAPVQAPNSIPNHFFGGDNPMLYYNSHNVPSTSQIIIPNHNNHAEDPKSFFSSLKLSPSTYPTTTSVQHPQQHQNINFPPPPMSFASSMEDEDGDELSKSQIKLRRESPEARERRLQRNAERMRQRRAHETPEQRRERLDKNALNNRLRRMGESETEKVIRQVRDAARQRVRRAMESDDERDCRLKKLADRMREVRKSESPEVKAERLAKATVRARERIQSETSEERKLRLQKGAEHARKSRADKKIDDDYFSQFPTNSYTSSDVCTLNIPQYHSVFQSSAGGLQQHAQIAKEPTNVPNVKYDFAKKSTAPRNSRKKDDHQQVFTNFSEAQTTALILEPIIEMNT
jgi:hypothetical protein